MARVTVEDCITVIANRFELVVLAAQRSKDISSGVPITVDRDNDKNPVIALREIAAHKISTDSLKSALVQNFSKFSTTDKYEMEKSQEEEIIDDTAMEFADEDMVSISIEDDFADEDISFGDDNLDVED